MKKINALSAAAVCLFAAIAAYGQGGFTGPGSNQNKWQTVKASALKSLPQDSRVVLQGNITRAVGGEKYSFSDGTGEVTVDIDDRVWAGLSVSEKDKVEIMGKVEVKKKHDNARVVDVKSIKKI
ncbi:MAG: NirD/YgiW/YdeI family stress tolerance protein [Chitinispirillales bacterium]|jgi:uncharacterized protein (TIGR00156 family)|nr:NirD/YgiW/YdeI family stress tolerance protein [Chitinispirillales bacterium]